MKSIYLLSLLCGFATEGFAQAGVVASDAPRNAVDSNVQREQRRVELRKELKSQHQNATQTEYRKVFSNEDRQVLREQLRQRQETVKP